MHIIDIDINFPWAFLILADVWNIHLWRFSARKVFRFLPLLSTFWRINSLEECTEISGFLDSCDCVWSFIYLFFNGLRLRFKSFNTFFSYVQSFILYLYLYLTPSLCVCLPGLKLHFFLIKKMPLLCDIYGFYSFITWIKKNFHKISSL